MDGLFFVLSIISINLIINYLFIVGLCFVKFKLNSIYFKCIIKIYLLYSITIINVFISFIFIHYSSSINLYFVNFISIRLNILTNWLILTVLIVSSCVILNSIDYLSIIDSYLLLVYILLFVFIMVSFICCHDLILAFLFWDLLGIISYLLINFFSSKLNCGIKAVVFNKLGDCSFVFILSISYSYLTFINYYPFLSFSFVFSLFHCYVINYQHHYLTIFIALLFIVFTKSAQLPFSSWLLNAMNAPTPISALLHSSTMVIAGVIIGLFINDLLIELIHSSIIYYVLYLLMVLTTLLWSLIKATMNSDIKSIIACSTISQISYMFIALLIHPLVTLYHIIVHALFKSLLFLLSGSLIHIQYNYQSLIKLKSNHSLIKISLLFGLIVLILALSKELIIHSANETLTSFLLSVLLIVGTIYTIIYSFNIYLICFYYSYNSLINQSYYSFLIPSLAISALIIDISLNYSISLNSGTIFYAVDNGSFITNIIINEPLALIVIPLIIISFTPFISLNNSSFTLTHSFSTFSQLSSSSILPAYQDLIIIMSSYFIKGPINALEVMSCLNHCYNLYHIHYFNILFLIYLLLLLILFIIIH